MNKRYFVWTLGLLASWVLLSPGRAQAYLDPGTGSYLFQILIAALVGGLFAVKLFWGRIRLFFLGLFGKKGGEETGGEGDGNGGQLE
jgi:hypothetical protein